MEMFLEAEAENKMRQSQQFEFEEPSNTGMPDSEEPSNAGMSDSEEPSNTGKYTGNISKPPVDFIENDCSKVEKCFHSHYNSESDKSNNLSYLDDRVNMYIESESESENEKSTCYSDHTGSDFGNDECDRNLEGVKCNIMFAFEQLSKNKQVNGFREILCLFWMK